MKVADGMPEVLILSRLKSDIAERLFPLHPHLLVPVQPLHPVPSPTEQVHNLELVTPALGHHMELVLCLHVIPDIKQVVILV